MIFCSFLAKVTFHLSAYKGIFNKNFLKWSAGTCFTQKVLLCIYNQKKAVFNQNADFKTYLDLLCYQQLQLTFVIPFLSEIRQCSFKLVSLNVSQILLCSCVLAEMTSSCITYFMYVILCPKINFTRTFTMFFAEEQDHVLKRG